MDMIKVKMDEMKGKGLIIWACVLGITTIFTSCAKDEEQNTETEATNTLSALNLPEESFNYADIDLPEHYQVNNFPARFPFQQAAVAMDNTPATNPITDAGATLGRVLFYDTKLSANGKVSCASCHQSEHGFSDPAVLSVGFEGGHTRRHSMGLVNARFYQSGKFFWDERANTLEEQVLMPFQDEVEMGLSLPELEQIISEQEHYPTLFKRAFGSEQISSERVSKALAQFVRSLVSTTSKYDKARTEVQTPTENFPSFTAQENRGKRLFYFPIQSTTGEGAINCAGCHVSEAFVGPIPPRPNINSNATNNGLDASSIDDLGVFEATGIQNDLGKFKSPSLRNIGLTAPYMHDGRFATLEEVIDHYDTGIQNHANLGGPLRDVNGNPIRLNLSETDKADLLAFLHTLTDTEMLQDEKYSNPFK